MPIDPLSNGQVARGADKIPLPADPQPKQTFEESPRRLLSLQTPVSRTSATFTERDESAEGVNWNIIVEAWIQDSELIRRDDAENDYTVYVRDGKIVEWQDSEHEPENPIDEPTNLVIKRVSWIRPEE